MLFAQDQDMIQAVAPKCPDQTCRLGSYSAFFSRWCSDRVTGAPGKLDRPGAVPQGLCRKRACWPLFF